MRPLHTLLGLLAVAGLLFLPACNSKPDAPAATPSVASAPIRFRDVTREAGIRFERVNGAFGKKWMPETMGGGGGFADYDGDGWLDILLVNGDFWPGHAPPGKPRPTLALYRNNGDGTFADVTREAGLAIPLQGMGLAVGDCDGDGYDDLCITAVGGSRLFRNAPLGNGRRRFEEITAASGLRDTGWPTSAAWLDYDRDGRLDLFVCHYLQWSPQTDIFCGTTFKAYCRPQEYPGESYRLYRNIGSAQGVGAPRFEDVTERAGLLNKNSKALGVCVCDLNRDGWPDLIVANDTEPNAVYRNRKDGAFEEIGLTAGIALDDNGKARAGMGIDLAEYRPDEMRGLAIGNFNLEGIAFYDIGGEPPYPERAKQAGVFDASYPYITFGLFFADFDNDGWPDLFATNGHISDTIERSNPGQSYAQPSLLFHNRGDGTFAEVGKAAGEGIAQPLVGRGACRGDFDNDGRVDILLIPNIGPPRLLRNETEPQRNWLLIRLRGAGGNRNGVGATVTVEAGGRKMSAYAASGSSYLSAHDPRLHFGLGTAPQVERITVTWLNGKAETHGPHPANRVVTLTEGRKQATAAP